MFCQEAVEEVRVAFDADPAYPPVLFVHSATTEEAREFFDAFWPEARVVSDPEKNLYTGFDLKSASLREMFGPGVWLRALSAVSSGHRPRGMIGNVWLMPGIFFVRGTEVLWS